MAKKPKEDTPEYQEQQKEFTKNSGDTETISVGKEGATNTQINLQEYVATQTEIVYKANVLEILIEIERTTLDLKKDVEVLKNEISRK